MKLFHWSAAECNKLYSRGDIVVMAESVEQARGVAKRTRLTETKGAGL